MDSRKNVTQIRPAPPKRKEGKEEIMQSLETYIKDFSVYSKSTISH